MAYIPAPISSTGRNDAIYTVCTCHVHIGLVSAMLHSSVTKYGLFIYLFISRTWVTCT